MFYDSPTMLKQNLLRTISNMQEVSQLFVSSPKKTFLGNGRFLLQTRSVFFCL